MVEDRSKDTLLPIIQQRIKVGSIIYSDCWSSYAQLNTLGYEYYTVNHLENFKDPVTTQLTSHGAQRSVTFAA